MLHVYFNELVHVVVLLILLYVDCWLFDSIYFFTVFE